MQQKIFNIINDSSIDNIILNLIWKLKSETTLPDRGTDVEWKTTFMKCVHSSHLQ